MPMNPQLLVAADMLQDYIVDKDTGFPLANGEISLHIDTARTFYKNWYYQTGVPGNYNYIPLDNPLHLSSVGTIQDPNGNDVIPFYYPFDESSVQQTAQAYYITVYSTDNAGNRAVLQFTRENFPAVAEVVPGPGVNLSTLRNYIVNNVYWHNLSGTKPITLTTVLNQVIAPSQHDGYTNGDIRFIKNIAGSADIISFQPITQSWDLFGIDDVPTPETSLNFTSDGATSNETQKCVQYPISLHVSTLQSTTVTVIVYAQNVAGAGNAFFSLKYYQFLGSGAVSQPLPQTIPMASQVPLSNDWGRFIFTFDLPALPGLSSLGPGGDDALFLQFEYPHSVACAINHTKPQLYIGSIAADNDFDTYDQVNSIICSPRTGDVRIALNYHQPFGWVAANDGSIGNSGATVSPNIATTRANSDTWPLYNFIWNNVLNFWAPMIDGGSRGSSSIEDFSANRAMALTKIMGRVLAGLNPLTPSLKPQTITISNYDPAGNKFLLNIGSSALYPTGTPVVLTAITGGLSGVNITTVYYVINVDATHIELSLSEDFSNLGLAVDLGSNGFASMSSALGAYFGEGLHSLNVMEIAAHTHKYTALGMSSGSPFQSGTDIATMSIDTGSTGGAGSSTSMGTSGAQTTAHNTMQPTSFMNIYLKL